jgi:hypothetical protein
MGLKTVSLHSREKRLERVTRLSVWVLFLSDKGKYLAKWHKITYNVYMCHNLTSKKCHPSKIIVSRDMAITAL